MANQALHSDAVNRARERILRKENEMASQSAFGVVLRSFGVIALLAGPLYVATGVLTYLSGEIGECGWHLTVGMLIVVGC